MSLRLHQRQSTFARKTQLWFPIPKAASRLPPHQIRRPPSACNLRSSRSSSSSISITSACRLPAHCTATPPPLACCLSPVLCLSRPSRLSPAQSGLSTRLSPSLDRHSEKLTPARPCNASCKHNCKDNCKAATCCRGPPGARHNPHVIALSLPRHNQNPQSRQSPGSFFVPPSSAALPCPAITTERDKKNRRLLVSLHAPARIPVPNLGLDSPPGLAHRPGVQLPVASGLAPSSVLY